MWLARVQTGIHVDLTRPPGCQHRSIVRVTKPDGDVEDYWGDWESEASATLRANQVAIGIRASLFHCIERLFSCGPCNVQKDDNSLLVTTAPIVFGINWHPVNSRTLAELIPAGSNDLDPAWPKIGTWSLNS